MRELFWKALHSRWSPAPDQREAGYTLLLLIPGDLPVFLDIAMQVCGAQQGVGLVETLVIPDQVRNGFRERVERQLRYWPHGHVRLTPLRSLDQWLANRLRNPHKNCWLQLLQGVEKTQTRYALWHDADAFLASPDFLADHFRQCRNSDLACLGVSPAWDGWFADQGYGHLVATWELMFNVEWLRTFRPWEIGGRKAMFAGQKHVFDISFWAQCLTPPSRIGRRECANDFVHFNYVISTYRWYQRASRPFEDVGFRLLLIRMLIDAFEPDNDVHYEVPTLQELIAGISEDHRRVTYRRLSTWTKYPEFQGKFERLTCNPSLTEAQRRVLRDGIAVFEEQAKLSDIWARVFS